MAGPEPGRSTRGATSIPRVPTGCRWQLSRAVQPVRPAMRTGVRPIGTGWIDGRRQRSQAIALSYNAPATRSFNPTHELPMSRQIKLFVCTLSLLLLLFTPSAGADALGDVLERGKLRVGVSLFVPWAMRDKAGDLAGFEIDVARKLARDMGVEPEFKVYVWEEIVAALRAKEIDVIVSGMAITPSRALQLNFTNPYVESGVGLATHTARTREIGDMRELNAAGITVVTVTDTLGSDVASLLFDKADIKVVATSDEAESLVLDGQAHAYVASLVETKFLALEHPDVVDAPLSRPLLVSVAGMGVRKGEQELLNFLNAWIAARTADQWLSATRRHWFESLDWRDEVVQE